MSRYYDILCPDATRVVLQNRPPDNDFIHANWMTMPDKFRYISAQVLFKIYYRSINPQL